MNIHNIEVNNFKAFYGKHVIETAGKNLFIYGENGSGKSSLYYALKDFFQASVENIDLDELENEFLDPSEKGNCYIKITFQPDPRGKNPEEPLELSKSVQDPKSITQVSDTNKLKSFLTYKKFLGIHNVKKDSKVNLFDLLVRSVLYHYKNPILPKELGELWKDCERAVSKKTDRSYTIQTKRNDVNRVLKAFNDGFEEMFRTGSPECIKDSANEILSYFKYNLEIDLAFKKPRPNSSFTGLIEKAVELNLKYRGKAVENPQLLLNEARLTAIALSIYFASILKQPQLRDFKILFLDDIFIGLDMSNRFPVLEIIKDKFEDYQIIVTTYDRHWFNHVKNELQLVQKDKWVFYEFYTHKVNTGVLDIDCPVVRESENYLAKSLKYIRSKDHIDYPAAANFLRKEAERIILNYLPVKELLHSDGKPRRWMLRGLINQAKEFLGKIDHNALLLDSLQTHLRILLNPLSHFEVDTPIYKRELEEVVENLIDLEGYLKGLQSNRYKHLLPETTLIRLTYNISPTETGYYELPIKDDVYLYKDEGGDSLKISPTKFFPSETYIVNSQGEQPRSPLSNQIVRNYSSIQDAYEQIHSFSLGQFPSLPKEADYIDAVEYMNDTGNWSSLRTILSF